MWKWTKNSFVSGSDWFWGKISSKSVVVDIFARTLKMPGNSRFDLGSYCAWVSQNSDLKKRSTLYPSKRTESPHFEMNQLNYNKSIVQFSKHYFCWNCEIILSWLSVVYVYCSTVFILFITQTGQSIVIKSIN